MNNKCPFSHLHEPRGPKGLPIIHSFLDTAVNVLQFLTTTREKYGDIAKYKIFGITHYLVSHPDDIAQVYKEETKGAFSKKRFHEVLYPFFGNGLFNSQGKDWERQRKQIQPFFHKSKIPNWFPLVVEETQNHFKSIKPQASELQATELMQATVQSIMSRILFGLKLDNEDSRAAVAAIEGVSERMADHGLKSFIFNGILNKLPTPANLKFKRQLQTIDYSIRKISENNDAKDEAALLPLFAQFMSAKELRDQLFTLYFAGQETTVNSLSWVIYYLAQYPEFQQRARSEVQQYWSTGDNPRFTDLDQFVFLNAAIDEAMRLAPAAYLTYRDVENDMQLGAYRLKKKALLMLSMYVTHRHPDFWEKPAEYNPERFLNRNNKGFAFYPYGGGMRVCTGIHLARMEITTIMALFVMQYKFSLKPGEEVSAVTHLTLKPKDGISLIINSVAFSECKSA
jgi:cytochrome P450